MRASLHLHGNFRRSIKYPSLVSYNRIPWEIVSHDGAALHMHLCPQVEQLLSLAATTSIPHLHLPKHVAVSSPSEQLRVLPGMMYVIQGAAHAPADFSAGVPVRDPTSLQHYGRLHSAIASVDGVQLYASNDQRLLCLAIQLGQLRDSVQRGAATTPYATLHQYSTQSSTPFTLYYFLRPNRPASELTRPFERFFVHRPNLSSLMHLQSSTRSWTPVLQPPKRTTKASPPPRYVAPTSYLMGLAERLGVVPGNCFGRRSLMWGTYF